MKKTVTSFLELIAMDEKERKKADIFSPKDNKPNNDNPLKFNTPPAKALIF